MLKVLVVAVLALVLAGGAWALFLREDEQGSSILVGALEDGVKFPEPEIADQRVELAEQAGFNALDVTTAWEPGRTEPDPGELLVLSNVARATAKRKGASSLSRVVPANTSLLPWTATSRGMKFSSRP